VTGKTRPVAASRCRKLGGSKAAAQRVLCGELLFKHPKRWLLYRACSRQLELVSRSAEVLLNV
jgi:hypothetical protein